MQRNNTWVCSAVCSISFQSFDGGTNDEGGNVNDNAGINPFGNDNEDDNAAFTIRSVSFPPFDNDDNSDLFRSGGNADENVDDGTDDDADNE